MRGEQYDQAKLSRILDVAQDLKVCDGARAPAWQPSLLPASFKGGANRQGVGGNRRTSA